MKLGTKTDCGSYHGSVLGAAGSSSVNVLFWSGAWSLNDQFVEILGNRTN